MISELIRLSRQISSGGPAWIQGPGGNVSIKKGNKLYIKASGFRLDQVTPRKGWVFLPSGPVLRRIKSINIRSKRAESLYALVLKGNAGQNNGGARPSMETGMHLVLGKPVVMHFHALAGLLMAHEYKRNSDRFHDWMKSRWRGEFRLIEMCKPGLELSTKIMKHPHANLFLLENHGVLMQGVNGRVLHEWKKIEKKFLSEWEYSIKNANSKKPAPFRFYFPDTAVFQDRIAPFLIKKFKKKGEWYFVIRPDAKKTDLDAWEMWEANRILFHLCPNLKQIPSKLKKSIVGLPMEKFRIKLTRKEKV